MFWLILFLGILFLSVVMFAILTANSGTHNRRNSDYLEHMNRRHTDYFNNPIVEYMKRQNKD